jgi:hypothetical protein
MWHCSTALYKLRTANKSGVRRRRMLYFVYQQTAILTEPINRSLNAIVAQLEKCPFWVNITIYLKTIKTTNNNKIQSKSLHSQRNSKIVQCSLRCYHILFCSFLKQILFDVCHYCIQRAGRANFIKTSILYLINTHWNTRWFKYDQDKLWPVHTQSVPVIFEPPCMFSLVKCHV